MEYYVDAMSLENLTVPFKIPRILGEVFIRSELNRIDEDGCNGVIVVFVALVH